MFSSAACGGVLVKTGTQTGVTTHDWRAEAPPGALTVNAKLLGTHACCAVGVQVIVLPFSVAPSGALVNWESIAA
jgi:hypothetical protein